MTKRYPSFEDMNTLERYTSADYCETRNLLAWASNQTGIHLKDLVTGEEKPVTAGGRGEGSVQFSPDGSRLLFLSTGPSGRQAFFYHIDTEEITPITHADAFLMDPLLSPDGTKILFSAPLSAGTAKDYSAEKVNALDGSIVIEHFGYKFDGAGYITPDDHMHLLVCDITSGECHRVTEGICDFLHPVWCRDSEHILCESDAMRSKDEILGYDLLKINVNTGEMTQLTRGLDLVSYPNPVRPMATPDSRYAIIGVLSRPLRDDEAYPEVYFYRTALDGSGSEKIFEPDEGCYQCTQFPYNAGCGWGLEKAQIDESGTYVYFVAGWQGQGRIYRVPVTGGHGELVSGGKQVWHGLGRIQSGKMLIARSTCGKPEQYFILDTRDGSMTLAQQSAQDYLDTVEIQETDDFFFDSEDGTVRVHAFVIPPYGREPGKKYPVLVYVHGGPYPFYTYGFTPEHHAFAAQGYGILFCNPRGTSSYGRSFADLKPAYDGHAASDVLKMVDEAAARYSWMDPDRAAVTGGSYGGFMVNWLATHTKRFRCYITQRSLSNAMITYASSDMQGSSLAFERYEDFIMDRIEDPETAVAHAEEVDRPLLILHGTDDLRTPVEGAHQFFVAVKDTHPDLPVRMVLFPHTSHDQATDPHFHGRYHQEMLDWLKKYL